MHNTLRSVACIIGVSLCTPLVAQTEVQRYDATAETSYGVIYTLPRTEIEVQATILEQIYQPGIFHAYAEKYIGQKASGQSSKHYKILDLRVKEVGVPDSTKRYVVTFDKKTVAPFVKLTEQNILHSINSGEGLCPEPIVKEFKILVADTKLPSLPREYALASSQFKQAEVAAAHLYELREHLMSLVTGDVENMPKDGAAMKLVLERLQTEERRTMRLFYGDTLQRTLTHTVRIAPDSTDIVNKVLFRFSEDWGIVKENDLSGDPVLLDMKIVERAPELSDKELKKLHKVEGIMYNIPGRAEVQVSFLGKELAKEKISLTQVGGMQSLAKKMFNIKDKNGPSVYFDIKSGAILNIRQE